MVQYLNEYCDHFKLRQYIHFKSTVQSIKPIPSSVNDNIKWQIEYDSPKGHQTIIVDYVGVCNGKNSLIKFL